MDNYFTRTDTDAIKVVSRLVSQNHQVYVELHLTEDYHCRFVYVLRTYVASRIVAKVYFHKFVDNELDSFFYMKAPGEYDSCLPF